MILARTVVLLITLVMLVGSSAAADSDRLVLDGALRVPLPSGWFGSVGPGMQGTHPVAWIACLLRSDASDHVARRVPRLCCGGTRIEMLCATRGR
jgi:hypothetical protein